MKNKNLLNIAMFCNLLGFAFLTMGYFDVKYDILASLGVFLFLIATILLLLYTKRK